MGSNPTCNQANLPVPVKSATTTSHESLSRGRHEPRRSVSFCRAPGGMCTAGFLMYKDVQKMSVLGVSGGFGK